MNRAPYVLFAAALIACAAGLWTLATRDLAGGSVYPAYSSLRADPEGSKLLYDALARLPGIAVERNFLPLSGAVEKPAAIFVIGVVPESFNSADQDFRPIESVASAGSRVILAFHFERSLTELKMPLIEKNWGVRAATDKSNPHNHPFFFLESKDWTPLRASGQKILAMERPFGSGSIVLVAESTAFANDSVLAGLDTDLISQAIAGHHAIVFDESHLGIAEAGSVVALARRFHLMGFVAGLALCAALFLWKNIPGFPPPAPVPAAARSGITAQAGLATLLRRHLPARDLAATCWRAWLETNRRTVSQARIERAEKILLAPSASPAGTLRQIGAVLQSKGEL